MINLLLFEDIAENPVSLGSTVTVAGPREPCNKKPDRLSTDIEGKDKYTILGKLGNGAMGTVHLARSSKIGYVAIKQLLSEEYQGLERFEREASILRTLTEHNVENVPRFIEYIKSSRCIVMEYVRGHPLDQKPPEESDKIGILHDVSSTLYRSHQLGILHRDVKPSNLIAEKNTSQVYLTDFGLAGEDVESPSGTHSHPHHGMTGTGVVLGTPDYCAPEVLNGDPACIKSDVYSLGVTAYEIFSGSLPRGTQKDGEDLPTAIIRLLGFSIKPLRDIVPKIQPELADLVMSALKKKRGNRPTSEEFYRTLGTYR